ASFTVTSGNKLDVTLPALPSGAVESGVYVGTTTGDLYFQTDEATTSYSQSTPIATTIPPPDENTTAEKLQVTIPAIPYHANSINIYISTATDTETLERNTTELVEVFTEPLDGGGVS